MPLPIDPIIIDKFRDEYAFLSNFFIEPDGTHVEGEYQSEKTVPASEYIKKLTPGKAKREGKKIKDQGKLRADWYDVNILLMFRLVARKFLDHPLLRKKLLASDNAVLIEGNNWGDTFWGQVNGKGENYLGKILMLIRRILKGEVKYTSCATMDEFNLLVTKR